MSNWKSEHGEQYVPPSWVLESGARDESWGNDPGGARFVYGAFDESANAWQVEVWVDSASRDNREDPDNGRFTVAVVGRGAVNTEDDRTARATVEEALCALGIRAYTSGPGQAGGVKEPKW